MALGRDELSKALRNHRIRLRWFYLMLSRHGDHFSPDTRKCAERTIELTERLVRLLERSLDQMM